MTMTTRSRARTAAALAEEAGAVEDLHLSAAQQALSNRRQPPASVSQFWSFTARNPTAPLTPRRDAASQSLRGSADPGRHESASGDRFPYRRDPTPERRESGRFQWFGPEDGPGDDPDDPRDNGNNDNDDDDNDFVDATDELDPGLAVFQNLAVAVNRLSHSSCRTNNSSSSHAKVHEPDTFDGTDPKKLRTFLVQCELCFQDRAKAFRLDRAKVTFAQSYLKGMTLEWFEPDLLHSSDPADRPLWMDSWVHFVAELQSTFGPHDPIADAEHQLEHLRMKDAHRVTRYIVDFNQLASQVQDYGDGALRCLFYSGLPDRLKDEIARVGKPLTLNGLRALCQEIDAVETHASLGAHIPISVHPTSFVLLSTATRTQLARELSDTQLGTPDRVLRRSHMSSYTLSLPASIAITRNSFGSLWTSSRYSAQPPAPNPHESSPMRSLVHPIGSCEGPA